MRQKKQCFKEKFRNWGPITICQNLLSAHLSLKKPLHPLYSTQKRRSSDAFIFINRCFKTCAGYKNLASEVYLFLIPVMTVYHMRSITHV